MTTCVDGSSTASSGGGGGGIVAAAAAAVGVSFAVAFVFLARGLIEAGSRGGADLLRQRRRRLHFGDVGRSRSRETGGGGGSTRHDKEGGNSGDRYGVRHDVGGAGHGSARWTGEERWEAGHAWGDLV